VSNSRSLDAWQRRDPSFTKIGEAEKEMARRLGIPNRIWLHYEHGLNWEQKYRLRQATRTSLVLWAALALATALVCAPAVRCLDRATGWGLFHFSPDGARAVLQALTGSMLTFIVFVFSALLIVVQLAIGQLTPRVIAIVFARPRLKAVLAMLTFTYVYTLSALGRIEDRVPDLHVSVAVILNLACIGAFFLFVQELSSGLRPTSVMREVAQLCREVIREIYPADYSPGRAEQTVRGLLPSAPMQVIKTSRPSGVVMAFRATELVRLAREADAVLELVPEVGDYLPNGDPLFRVFGKRAISEDALRGCVAIGDERTLEQDPRFAFRILVDIAIKALSPAINDPTTAVLALDQIHHLLLDIGRRQLDDGQARDQQGNLRLVYATPAWSDYVLIAVSEIRQYGGGSLQVDRRLRALLNHLTEVLPEERWPPLSEELRLLNSSVQRGFRDEEDSKRAGLDDYQGVGGTSPRRRREPDGVNPSEVRP
jgi:uncharacterized membrane protein